MLFLFSSVRRIPWSVAVTILCSCVAVTVTVTVGVAITVTISVSVTVNIDLEDIEPSVAVCDFRSRHLVSSK